VVGGFLDLVVDEETGLLVPPGDVSARLGAAARQRVRKQLSWARVTQATLDAYEDVLAREVRTQSAFPSPLRGSVPSASRTKPASSSGVESSGISTPPRWLTRRVATSANTARTRSRRPWAPSRTCSSAPWTSSQRQSTKLPPFSSSSRSRRTVGTVTGTASPSTGGSSELVPGRLRGQNLTRPPCRSEAAARSAITLSSSECCSTSRFSSSSSGSRQTKRAPG
jgi:hypothetical protein